MIKCTHCGNEQCKVNDTALIFQWIEESHGKEVASDWLWGCTPYPAGPPSDEMLEEGLALACKEITLNSLHEKVWLEMDRAMKEYHDQCTA